MGSLTRGDRWSPLADGPRVARLARRRTPPRSFRITCDGPARFVKRSTHTLVLQSTAEVLWASNRGKRTDVLQGTSGVGAGSLWGPRSSLREASASVRTGGIGGRPTSACVCLGLVRAGVVRLANLLDGRDIEGRRACRRAGCHRAGPADVRLEDYCYH